MLTGRVRRGILKARIAIRRGSRQRAERDSRALALKRNKALKDAEVAITKAAEIEKERQAQATLATARQAEKEVKDKARQERQARGRDSLRSIGLSLRKVADELVPAKKKRKTAKKKTTKKTPRKKTSTVTRSRR